jgi:hypothetical protein
LCDWLKKEGDSNILNDKKTPLITAIVQSRNIRQLKLLLKNKNIFVNQKDAKGKTALDYAIELDDINEDSPMVLQHLQYDICTCLVNKSGKVTSVKRDSKLRAFLLKGKPKYNKTLLGFCVDNSSNFVSCATAYKMSFLGPFVSVATNFIGAFFVYSVDRISQYRRFKKFNHSYLLS